MIYAKFGLTKDSDDIYWLLQNGGHLSNAINLPADLAEIKKLQYIRRCPHNIDLKMEVPSEVLAACEDFELPEIFSMAPPEQAEICWYESVGMLSVLRVQGYIDFASPAYMPVFPAWMDMKALRKELTNIYQSNLVTPIVYGDFVEHSDRFEAAIELAKINRSRLLLMGPSNPDPFNRHGDIKKIDSLPALPEALKNVDARRQAGVYILNKFMRGEGNGRS